MLRQGDYVRLTGDNFNSVNKDKDAIVTSSQIDGKITARVLSTGVCFSCLASNVTKHEVVLYKSPTGRLGEFYGNKFYEGGFSIYKIPTPVANKNDYKPFFFEKGMQVSFMDNSVCISGEIVDLHLDNGIVCISVVQNFVSRIYKRKMTDVVLSEQKPEVPVHEDHEFTVRKKTLKLKLFSRSKVNSNFIVYTI